MEDSRTSPIIETLRNHWQLVFVFMASWVQTADGRPAMVTFAGEVELDDADPVSEGAIYVADGRR